MPPKYSSAELFALVAAFHLSVADIFAIGEDLVETGHFSRYVRDGKDYPKHSPERAAAIALLACKEFRLNASVFISPESITAHRWRIVEDYLTKKSSDGALLSGVRNLLSQLLIAYLPKKN